MNALPRGSKSVAIVMGIVAVLGLLALLRWGSSESRAEGIGLRPPSPGAEVAGVSQETSRAVEVVEPGRMRRPVGPATEVRPAAEGWVVDADGVAIPGALTRIGCESVSADEAGHFTWWFLPEVGATSRLEVQATGFRSAGVELQPRCTIVLQRALAREIEVWDLAIDRPVAGAEVRVYGAVAGDWWGWAPLAPGEPRSTLLTDAAGRVTIPAELDRGSLALVVQPPGGEARAYQLSHRKYRGDPTNRVDARRVRPFAVRVQRAGNPVVGALVRARDGDRNFGLRFPTAVTDGSGLASLEVVGRRLELQIEGRGLRWFVEPELEEGQEELLVEVPDGDAVHGRLTCADPADLSYVEVGLRPAAARYSRAGAPIEWTRPETDGSWRFEPEEIASRWTMYLRFSPGGHTYRARMFEGMHAPDAEVPASSLLELDVLPPALCSPDALEVWGHRFDWSEPRPLLARDVDGLRRVRVPLGEYELLVTGPGESSNELELKVDARRQGIVVDLSRRTLEGTVVYGGEPARGLDLWVNVRSEGGWDSYRTSTDGAGAYRLVGLPPGEVQVALRATDAVRLIGKDRVWRKTWFDVPPGTERFDIELEAAWLSVETRGGGRLEGSDRIVLCRCPNGTTGGTPRRAHDLEAPPGPIVREWRVEGPASFRCRPGPGEWVVCYLGANGLVTEQIVVLESGAEESVVFDRGRVESTFVFASGK